MGKLDLSSFQYLTAESIRVLQAVEFKHRNFEVVPGEVIASCFPQGFGSIQDIVKNLCYSGLLCFETSRKHRGYRLTNLGYDYLALKDLVRRHKVSSFGHQIGVGKESNIYLVDNSENDQEDALCMKLTRLGRTCFRNIKNKRDYIPNNRKNKSESWLSLSKASALKEYTFMHKLKENGFPVPTPYAFNRHCIVMDYIIGTPLKYVKELHINTVANLYKQLMDLIVKFAQYGCIHGDFNEFNIILQEEDEHPIIIDFPQMVSTKHINAKMFFERDVNCIRTFFGSRFNYESKHFPIWSEIEKIERIKDLDLEVHATGFSKRQNDLLLRAFALNDENHLEKELESQSEDEKETNSDESEKSCEDGDDESSTETENSTSKINKSKVEYGENSTSEINKNNVEYAENSNENKYDENIEANAFMSMDKRKVVNEWVNLMSPSDKSSQNNVDEDDLSEAFLNKYKKEKDKVEGNTKKMIENLDDLDLSDSDSSSFKSAESTEIDIEDSASQIRKNGKKKAMTINDVLKDVNQRVSVEAKKKIRQKTQKNACKNARRATVRVGRSHNKKTVHEYNKGWDRFDF